MSSMTKNFTIGPINDALRKDLKPYATPEDSFEELTNAYQFRGRIIRKEGYEFVARLSTDGGTTFLGLPVMGLKIQELFAINLQAQIGFDTVNAYLLNSGIDPPTYSLLPSVQTVVWSGTDYQFFWTTNYSGGFWVTNSKPGLNGQLIMSIDNSNPAVVTTISSHGYTTGQNVTIINVSGYNPISASTPSINGQVFVITVTGPNTFTLNGLNGTLYNSYASNGIALNSQVSVTGQDGIRYYGNMNDTATHSIGNSWVNYNPPIDPNNALAGALMIFAYRGYLVFLNTTEGNNPSNLQPFPNRARWTQIGTPYYSYPVPNTPNIQGVDPNAGRDDLFGRGGANDAPTSEAIVGAGFINDVLIVYFERSTWRLRFVNNSQNPFVWERVNVEFGSYSTFSCVTFDKGLMAIGNRGIVISDGNQTSRVDEKIPDDVFNIRQNNNGSYRVQGIRNFRKRLVYWTIPDVENEEGTYPDRVLVLNYDTKNWAYFSDVFTCFGYYYPSQTDVETWGSLNKPWNSYTETWESGQNQTDYEEILAGNQQGYVFQLVDTGSVNDPSLSISNISTVTVDDVNYTQVTCINHNIPDGTWINLTGITGTTYSDGVSLNGRNFKTSASGTNTFNINDYESIPSGNALGSTYVYTTNYVPILAGSVQINIGGMEFVDTYLDGRLISTSGSGTIDYISGSLVINFNSPISSTPVYIRIVSLNSTQVLGTTPVSGVYGSGGQIAIISNYDIQTKIFNFFGDDKRARLSKIDFYTNLVQAQQSGQFTCNIWADSSDVVANAPLPDNPQSNIVLTSVNPYQIGTGEQTIYRLFCDAIAQTLQLQLTMSDRQQAVSAINGAPFQLLSMMFTMRRGGRLV